MTTPRPKRTRSPKPAARTRGKPQTPARELKLRNGLARFSVEMPPALVEEIERSGAPDPMGRPPSRNVQINALCQEALAARKEAAKKNLEVATPTP